MSGFRCKGDSKSSVIRAPDLVGFEMYVPHLDLGEASSIHVRCSA